MKTIESAIVGQKFCKGSFAALFGADESTVVELVREPDNPHDANAVAVHVNGVKCGFVPAAQAVRLAEDIDGGKTVTASIIGNNLKLKITEAVL